MFRRVRSESLALAAVAAVLAVVVLPRSAGGQVYTQVRQERVLRTQVRAEVPTAPSAFDQDAEESQELGSFDRSFASTASAVGVPPDASTAAASAAASQRVTFGPASITGRVAIDLTAEHAGGGENYALGISRWDGGFRVDRPTPFSLAGNIRLTHLPGAGDGETGLHAFNLFGLPDDGGPMVPFYTYGDDGPLAGGERPVSASGMFEPGVTYRMNAVLHVTQSTDEGASLLEGAVGEITFNLIMVPEPGAAGVALAVAGVLALRRRR